MPLYRLTITANRSTTGVQRTFTLDVRADNAAQARASIGNRSVVDRADGAWFDEWRITKTRRA